MGNLTTRLDRVIALGDAHTAELAQIVKEISGVAEREADEARKAAEVAAAQKAKDDAERDARIAAEEGGGS